MLLAYIAIVRSSRPETVPESLFAQSCSPIRKETPAQVFFREFCKIFRTPILNNIFERLSLVLVRIGLVQRATNLSMFCIITGKLVFALLGFSFQLILH